MTTVQDAPLGKRLVFQTLSSAFNGWLYVSTSRIFGSATRPEIVKSYPCRPQLYPTRIYKPKDATADEKLPLYIILHGGGFVINNPSAEDARGRHFADHARCIVASLDYSKAPTHRFPTAYHDVVELALAVINDEELSIDKNKVVIGGNSAGGNLALACAQDPRLRPHLAGVIGLYPVCDATTLCAEKMATRPDPSVPDILESSYDDLLHMYVGQQENFDLGDPRISPRYFKHRIDLPQHVFLIGAEHDLLAAEAKAMAERLAEEEDFRKQETEHGWQAGGVKWELVKGMHHGFDQFGNGKAKEARRLEQKDELHREIVEWLGQVWVG